MGDALRFRHVLVRQHFDQHCRNDLPRQTEFVLEPAAAAFLAPSGKFRPKIIDLLLVLAVHDKRDRFAEFEHRSAVEPDELLFLELELNRHDRSGWPSGRPAGFLVITSGLSDLRVLENRSVKFRRLLGLIIEPQKRRDFLCDLSSHIRLVAYATDSLNAPWARLPISSGVTSSWCVAIDQQWPNGSVNVP